MGEDGGSGRNTNRLHYLRCHLRLHRRHSPRRHSTSQPSPPPLPSPQSPPPSLPPPAPPPPPSPLRSTPHPSPLTLLPPTFHCHHYSPLPLPPPLLSVRRLCTAQDAVAAGSGEDAPACSSGWRANGARCEGSRAALWREWMAGGSCACSSRCGRCVALGRAVVHRTSLAHIHPDAPRFAKSDECTKNLDFLFGSRAFSCGPCLSA